MQHEIRVKPMILAPIGTRCYLVYNRSDAIVIDPASSPGVIIENAALANVGIGAVLLTHGHFDHTGAAKEIADRYGADVYIHPDDVKMLTNPLLNASLACGMTPLSVNIPTKPINDTDKPKICGMEVSVIGTPGHTPGSVCYIIGDYIFTGDTYFSLGCYGRTDLPLGNEEKLKSSLKKLAPYIDGYKVCPGH